MGPRSHDAGTFGAAEWEPRLTRWVGGRLRHLCGLRAPRLRSAGLARRVDGSAPRRQAWLRDHPLRPGARPAPRVRLTLPARAVPDREAVRCVRHDCAPAGDVSADGMIVERGACRDDMGLL